MIGTLAWGLKVWLALLQPGKTYGQRLLALEFRAFVQEVMLLPGAVAVFQRFHGEKQRFCFAPPLNSLTMRRVFA